MRERVTFSRIWILLLNCSYFFHTFNSSQSASRETKLLRLSPVHCFDIVWNWERGNSYTSCWQCPYQVAFDSFKACWISKKCTKSMSINFLIHWKKRMNSGFVKVRTKVKIPFEIQYSCICLNTDRKWKQLPWFSPL